jgi:hypothetical protein
MDVDLLGRAHYRAGHYKEAAQFLEQSIAQSPSDAPPSHGTVHGSQLFLAMTKWQLGQHDDARRLLHEIEPAIDKLLDTPTFRWGERAAMEVYRREAETLIEPKEANEAVESNRTNDE